MEWNKQNLLDLESLDANEISYCLDRAESFREVSTRNVKKVPALRGQVVVLMFFEPSTRTKTSFSLAAKRMSADVVNFSASSSSLKKGESIRDTARNIEAMGIDTIVLRHSAPGASQILTRSVDAGIVNAGDGAHEHPTQGLIDLFTIRKHRGSIEGQTVAIVGDILHSRVARSNIQGLLKLGANVILCGPPTLLPESYRDLGVELSHDLDEVMQRADVLNLLRIQLERQNANRFPSIREYTRLFGVNEQRMEQAGGDILVMHPGPINRGVEVTPGVADGPQSVVLNQVTYGLAVRMAVLYLVSGDASGVNMSESETG